MVDGFLMCSTAVGIFNFKFSNWDKFFKLGILFNGLC